MKRAQGIQIETIIIAALLIAVLIIVLFLVVRHTTIFSKGAYTCEAQGADCVSSTAKCLEMGRQPLDFDCPEAIPACCKRQ
jgi:hypothetical protein